MKTVDDPIYSSVPPSLGSYYLTYAALIVLLIATVALASVNLGIMHTPVAFIIATIKALFVMWIFMHLRSGQKLILLLFGASIVFLGIAAFLTMTDYVTRNG